MKIALITDIHFGVRGASQYFIDRYKLFFKDVFFPYIDQQGVSTILCLGDTWEDRKSININALRAAREMFFNECLSRSIKVITILGNHDVYARNDNSTNSMDIFEASYPNVHLVNDYEEFTFGNKTFGLMSWVHRDNLEQNLNIIKAGKTDYLCGHFEISSFEMTKGNVCESGFSANLFSKYKMVLSGHFHIKNKIGNIYYIGNPFQTNWDDFGSERGFHIYDSESDDFTFIKNTYETYNMIAYSDEVDINSFDYSRYNGQLVKVVVGRLSNLDQMKYNLFIERLLAEAYEYSVVEIDTDEQIIRPDQIKIKSGQEMISDYIELLDIEESRKSNINNILLNLYSKALAISSKE